MSKTGFRDALAYADYPEEMGARPAEMSRMDPERTKALQERDREQYRSWLEERPAESGKEAERKDGA